MAVNVQLFDIAGLGTGSFGSTLDQTTFASCAVLPDGKKAYFGRANSRDPQMRNLVVASLDSAGGVLGVPQSYPTSTSPLDLIAGYPAGGDTNTAITAILVNAAKGRLYMAESRAAGGAPTTPGLNVYTLDSSGEPVGEVRTYPNGNVAGKGVLSALLLHPTQPLLYMAGWGMVGVAVQKLDAAGEPTGAPAFYPLGGLGKTALGISADAKFLYMGTSDLPEAEVLEVVKLDSDGNPLSSTLKAYKVGNAQVGHVADYLHFAMGAHAIYMVRPGLSGDLPFLALWPLDNTTGRPVGDALARTDIHPPLVGGNVGTMTVAVDDANNRLWVANPVTFQDAFTGETKVSGITPTSYEIAADGTLGIMRPEPSSPHLKNVAIRVPAGNPTSPLFFNVPRVPIGNRVKGYQCRVTVTAAPGASFPMTLKGTRLANGDLDKDIPEPSFGSITLGMPSAWAALDSLLKDRNYLVPIEVTADGHTGPITMRLDLADSDERILKSVTEESESPTVGFLLPGYAMGEAALAAGVPALQTYSQRTADYLVLANLHRVAATDRPKSIITDCYFILGGEANDTVLANLAETVGALGFNTTHAYYFNRYPAPSDVGLDPAHINTVLNTHGLFWRRTGSYWVGQTDGIPEIPVPDRRTGGYFGFDTKSGMTPANLTRWADSKVTEVKLSNGGSPAQIVAFLMADEAGWHYPEWLNNIKDTVKFPGYLGVFQNYLMTRGATYGFTAADLGGAGWSDLSPVGQSVGNPPGGAPLEKRKLYYWTMRFFAEAANDGATKGSAALRAAVARTAGVTHSVFTAVNWPNKNIYVSRWYTALPTDTEPDYAEGGMDWMLAGRTSACTGWTEANVNDTEANVFSVYAAALRSATQAGTGTQGFGAYLHGNALGLMPAGGKYKALSLVGSGAKIYCGYAFGPLYKQADGWSEHSSKLAHWNGVYGNPGTDAYAGFAAANRLIGRAERILYPGTSERSKIAILLPGSSYLWDGKLAATPYYDLEMRGLYYAISHGHNTTVDFVDETDIADGALTGRDYRVLYVPGPNVSYAAQTVIAGWIRSWGADARQLVLMPGAGVADEYNSPTKVFDELAGLEDYKRANAVFRDGAPPFGAPGDPYTTIVQITNADFYFDARSMYIRGPFRPLPVLLGVDGPSWTDLMFESGEPACTTKEYPGPGVFNRVTAFGFFPGWQYLASPDTTHMNQLPQDWSIMAREIAMMPVVRTRPPRTVHVYNSTGPDGQTLTEMDSYLTTSPVEALRLNVGSTPPVAVAVVLLNWGGIPIENLKVKVIGGVATPTGFELASGAPLGVIGPNEVILSLRDVDVLMISS